MWREVWHTVLVVGVEGGGTYCPNAKDAYGGMACSACI